MAVLKPYDGLIYDAVDKKGNTIDYVQYMLIRTAQMFQYDNLPDTIPANMLEYYLQMGGVACITDVDGKLYALAGGWGGEPDAYYRPTKFTVANPALKFEKTLTIGQDCVLIYNDSRYKGLRLLFERYASALVENDISIRMADIQARVISLITAGDDRTKQAAEIFLQQLTDGKLGVIADNLVMESVKALPYNNTAHQTITDLIELEQYLKASWFNELGLNSNYNMKREAINSDEAQLGKDALLPLVDDMLHCRERWVAEVNALYGTEIKVSFHSSWAHVEEDILEETMGVAITDNPLAPEDKEVTNDEVTDDKTTATSDTDGSTEDTTVEEEEVDSEDTDSEGGDDSQLEEQDYSPDPEREVKEDDHVIEVPVTDEEVDEAGEGNEEDFPLIDQETIEEGLEGENPGGFEPTDNPEIDESDDTSDNIQEDYNRNLKKRLGRGNL